MAGYDLLHDDGKNAQKRQPQSSKSETLLVYKGIFFASVSGIMFAATSAIAKYVRILDPFELTLVRFTGCVFLALVHIAYSNVDVLPETEFKVKLFIVLRGLLVTPTIASAFAAIYRLPVAEATVLIFTSPVFTAVLAKLLMKEPFTLPHWLSLFFTMLGVVFLTKLPQQLREFRHAPLTNSTESRLLGDGLAVLAAVLMSFMYILARKTKTVHEAVSVFHYSWISALVSAIILWFRGTYSWPRCNSEAALLLVMIATSFYGQYCMTKALRTNLAGPVSVIRAATDIALTYVIQITVFKDTPDIYGAIGTFCVGVAVVLVTSCPVKSKDTKT